MGNDILEIRAHVSEMVAAPIGRDFGAILAAIRDLLPAAIKEEIGDLRIAT